MAVDERNKWRDSFQKLRDGDMSMLQRVKLDSSPADPYDSHDSDDSDYSDDMSSSRVRSRAATCARKLTALAPQKTSRRVRPDEQLVCSPNHIDANDVAERTALQNEVHIKQECNTEPGHTAGASQQLIQDKKNNVVDTISTLRHLLTEETQPVSYNSSYIIGTYLTRESVSRGGTETDSGSDYGATHITASRIAGR